MAVWPKPNPYFDDYKRRAEFHSNKLQGELKRKDQQQVDKPDEWNAVERRRKEMQLGMMILQMLHAIEHLHTHGMFHMDLKADNVLIAAARNGVRGEQVLVGDFGTVLDDAVFFVNRGAMQPVGNQANRAPEMFRPVDRRLEVSKNDVWAIGCIAFHLMSGCHPFLDAHNQDQMQSNILNNRPVVEIGEHWSEELRRFVADRLLCGEFGGRPTASEARREAERLLWMPVEVRRWTEQQQQEWMKQRMSGLADSIAASRAANQQPSMEEILEAMFLSERMDGIVG